MSVSKSVEVTLDKRIIVRLDPASLSVEVLMSLTLGLCIAASVSSHATGRCHHTFDGVPYTHRAQRDTRWKADV
jgi:hypothetical protein